MVCPAAVFITCTTTELLVSPLLTYLLCTVSLCFRFFKVSPIYISLHSQEVLLVTPVACSLLMGVFIFINKDLKVFLDVRTTVMPRGLQVLYEVLLKSLI